MSKTRAFVSFDYDNDRGLKDLLIGQSKNPDSPFELADWSIKEAIDENWKAHAKKRIRAVDCVIVICGEHTDKATGVSAEVKIAQAEQIPYFLLQGYRERTCKKPTAASTDKIYNWTWENLKLLIAGGR